MRRNAKDQRLEGLERDFRPRLIACLRECANGRWGLLGHDRRENTKYLEWAEAVEVKQTAEEINELRSEFGQENPLATKLIEYCSLRGQNRKGEPKLARQFLSEIGEL